MARPFGLKEWLFVVALVVAVFLVYQPAWWGGFILDDDLHLANNPVLKPGGLLKTWVPGTYLNYWPLTFTAYRLQFDIWGLNPLGFHLVNIAVHAISALLVWRILLQLNAPGAMFAAALFALHPVNVESVAWIAQLKNILSLLLALLSVLLYLLSEEKGKRWCMVLSIAVFLLSTLAKGMVLTLPVVLLACAWWQRGRIGRHNLLRVLPFLLIGALMTGMEMWGQRLVGAGDAMVRSDSLLSRAAVAGCAVWFYLWKLIWPVRLIFVYPRWNIDPRDVLSYLPGVLLVAILALGWWQRRGWGRPVVMLLVCYVALLLPVLGFVNISYMRFSLVADHYQYAAMIVPCAIFAAVTATLGRQLWHRPTGYALCLASLAMLGGLTWQQSRRYADAELLYRTTIAENPNSCLTHNNLGILMAARGQTDEAIAEYRESLELEPAYVEAHNNLGNALAGRGRVNEAMAQYRKALQLTPGYTLAYNNLGNALAGRKQFDEAIAQYQKALKINPDFADAYNSLGAALAGCGRVNEAMAHYRKALEINPDFADAYNNLGAVLAGQGQFDEAMACFRKAVEIDPGDAEAYSNLGNALAGRGRLSEAITHYQQAVQIKPDEAEYHNNLGAALVACGRGNEALAEYRKALALNPRQIEAYSKLGAALVQNGQLDEGIAQYRKALEIDPRLADVHYNLGIALARGGHLDEAKAEYEKTLQIAPDYAKAHYNLGGALYQQGKIAEAIAHCSEFIRLQPDNVMGLNQVARALATSGEASLRDGRRAVELAQRAATLTDNRDPDILDTLAAAYAEAGRFPEAAQTAHKAMELAAQQDKQPLAKSIKAKLPLYQSQTPYHEMQPSAAPHSDHP